MTKHDFSGSSVISGILGQIELFPDPTAMERTADLDQQSKTKDDGL